MPRKSCQKPHLQQHDLHETPKLWRLVQATLDVRKDQPELLAQVLGLAHYAANLSLGMPVVAGPVTPEYAAAPAGDPDRIDHGTELLGDRKARLAGINVCAGRALRLVNSALYTEAWQVIVECRIGLGQKPLDTPCAGCVHSGQ